MLLMLPVILLSLCLLSGCGEKSTVRDSAAVEETAEVRWQDYNGKRLGVLVGPLMEDATAQFFPDSEYLLFNSYPDCATALLTGKIDGFLGDEPGMIAMHKENPEIDYIHEALSENNYAFAFRKDDARSAALCDELDAFLERAWADGTMDDIAAIWLGSDESRKTVDMSDLTGENGTIRVVTTSTDMPWSYIKDGKNVGYDIDLVVRFCRERGYALELGEVDFAGRIPAVQSGKYDFSTDMNATPERAEQVRFSTPTAHGGFVLVVRAEDLNTSVPSRSAPEYRTFEDLRGKTVSMITGAPFVELIRDKIAGVGELTYFNSTPDMLLALKSGKTDAALANCAVASLAVSRDPDLALLSDTLMDCVFGFPFAKGDPARDDWQAACDAIPEETKQALWEKWTGADDSKKTMPAQDWPGRNGTVQVAACDTLEPTCYIGENGALMGFDIEMILKMAEIMDVHVEFTGMEFSSVLASVQAGKALFGAGAVFVTEERMETMDFVEYFPASFVMIVRKAETASAEARASVPEITDYSGLSGKTVSMLTGAPFEDLVRSKAPTVGEFSFFNNMPDMLLALESDKTDAALINNAIAALAVNRDSALALFPQNLQDGAFGFAFAKGDPRRDTWQAACDAIPEAQIQAAWDKWTGADEGVKALPEQTWPGLNGTVRVAACDTLEPMSYAGEGGELIGFDLEVLLMIARALDVRVEFTGMEFSAILSSVQSGKADIGAGSIIITAERAESVDFVEYYPAAFVLIVRASAEANETESGFWGSVRDSFEKTFLRESRWKLFVQGIGTTLLITVLSIILGTVLGFGVYLLCRSGNPVANGVTRFFVWLIHGMPMVVLLMILYYIIFGKVAISGTIVAVIGFTLVFGASVYGMLKSGVGAVEKGQMEAAYALGYTDNRAFFRVILPQALPHFFPAYKGEITATIKATAIVGYVAVQDLTKMGDIVRSRTYEAFFPLIAVAVIYFILAGILTAIVNRLGVFIDPRRRKKEDVLKGVTVE